MAQRTRIVCPEMNSSVPSPSWSVFDVPTNSRPVPSSAEVMWFHRTAAASLRCSRQSLISPINAMSTSPRRRACCSVSIPPRPLRGCNTVTRMAARYSAVSASACLTLMPARAVLLLWDLSASRTFGCFVMFESPATSYAFEIAAHATFRLFGFAGL